MTTSKTQTFASTRWTAARIAAVLACLVTCLFLFGCGSTDAEDIKGVWKVEETEDIEVTVVFTDTEFKIVGNAFGYTLDPGSKTIRYTSEGIDYGEGTYSFSEDKQQLTIEQTDGEGGTETTTFVKVSDDTSAEPAVNGVTDDETDEQAAEEAEAEAEGSTDAGAEAEASTEAETGAEAEGDAEADAQADTQEQAEADAQASTEG